METVVGLKEFRQKVSQYARYVQRGRSFLVMRRSRPLFRITPFVDEQWEEVIDFTRIKKGGVDIHELLKRLA